MKNIIVCITMLLGTFFSYGQSELCLTEKGLPCGGTEESYTPKSITDHKILRINVQYILKSDGYGNFNPFGDGAGNTYNGYMHAKALIDYMNIQILANNEASNIPIGNSIPVLNPNISFVLDAVHYRYNTSEYFNTSVGQKYNLYGTDKPNVFNLFLNGSGGTGHASNISLTSTTKYIVSGFNQWWYFSDWVANGGTVPPPSWSLWMTAGHLCHELAHLMGLAHTVREPGGAPCSTSSPACDDACGDTPSAYYMVNTLGQPHPACSGNPWCSNNLMDYNGKALTPCQIDLMHNGLENGLYGYTTCSAIATDRYLCDIGYPKVSHFGKNIYIGGCGSPALEGLEDVSVYFAETVEFYETEFNDNSQLEVIQHLVCGF